MDKLEKDIQNQITLKTERLFKTRPDKLFECFKLVFKESEGIEDIEEQELGEEFNLAITNYQFFDKAPAIHKEQAKIYNNIIKKSLKVYNLIYN